MPKCAEPSCGRWRPERLAPRWAAGIRMNGLWYCSRGCVYHAARAGLDTPPPVAPVIAPLGPPRLGVLLRHLQAVSERDLAVALESQRESGCRLGAELKRLGFTAGDQVLRALARQGGVSSLASFDVRRVNNGPSWLSADTVQALGIMPFDVDRDQRIAHVICAAPVPRAAVRAMQKLTGWSPEVFLVSDEVWEAAVETYRSTTAAADDGAVTAAGIDAAAALVADAASQDRAVAMRHARWDRFTWIRVEGATQVSNVLVPGVMEGTCQAAHTAH